MNSIIDKGGTKLHKSDKIKKDYSKSSVNHKDR